MNSWIKMRSELLRSPRVVAMSRILVTSEEFRTWAYGDPSGRMSDDALRCVTCALLLRVWSDARSFGYFDGDDLFVNGFRVSDVDMWAQAPGVGQAMLEIGWLMESAAGGKHKGLVFPNFRQYNAPMDQAEKQAAYRRRKKESVTGALPTSGNNALPKSYHKRREEKSINTPVVPSFSIDFDRVRFPSHDLDSPEIRRMLQEWYSVRAKAHGALADPELAITRALELFTSARTLTHNLRRAISGQWKNLANREEPPSGGDSGDTYAEFPRTPHE